ncbi:four helix bundle protein [Wenzhouxiangella sp. AB-CW3]|uniref:four helix bundle protein n=1 Tax=Wenzhouxiangella sp. AB-CW3 TaxID=2771012 RepID=UPI001CC32845|nr:four helix bundle protein [Wenzhouxiangella sp. AB-CW3]
MRSEHRRQPNHLRLTVWKEGVSLAADICRLTRHFPRQVQFGLGLQMQRSAISVPSNIAEGAARGSEKELLRFLKISRGSLMELDTQIRIASEIELFDQPETLLERIRVQNAKLNALIQTQKAKLL